MMAGLPLLCSEADLPMQAAVPLAELIPAELTFLEDDGTGRVAPGVGDALLPGVIGEDVAGPGTDPQMLGWTEGELDLALTQVGVVVEAPEEDANLVLEAPEEGRSLARRLPETED
jgi:hypothetical protein